MMQWRLGKAPRDTRSPKPRTTPGTDSHGTTFRKEGYAMMQTAGTRQRRQANVSSVFPNLKSFQPEVSSA
jgi:hypothetical protein